MRHHSTGPPSRRGPSFRATGPPRIRHRSTGPPMRARATGPPMGRGPRCRYRRGSIPRVPLRVACARVRASVGGVGPSVPTTGPRACGAGPGHPCRGPPPGLPGLRVSGVYRGRAPTIPSAARHAGPLGSSPDRAHGPVTPRGVPRESPHGTKVLYMKTGGRALEGVLPQHPRLATLFEVFLLTLSCVSRRVRERSGPRALAPGMKRGRRKKTPPGP